MVKILDRIQYLSSLFTWKKCLITLSSKAPSANILFSWITSLSTKISLNVSWHSFIWQIYIKFQVELDLAHLRILRISSGNASAPPSNSITFSSTWTGRLTDQVSIWLVNRSTTKDFDLYLQPEWEGDWPDDPSWTWVCQRSPKGQAPALDNGDDKRI